MQTGVSQNTDIGDTGDGRIFLKRVENNFLNNVIVFSNGKKSRMYNLKSKTDIEKLFFGNINAAVEFFIDPSFEDAYGFRLLRDSTNTSYVIEVKSISNRKDANSKSEKEFLSKSFPAHRTPLVSKEEMKQSASDNSNKKDEESFQDYNIINISWPVKNEFADKLYSTIFSVIKNFVMKGDPADILDGYTVTFRCVAGDEVWTLIVQEPDGELLQLTNICKQLVEEIKNKHLDESKICWIENSQ
jgi:hypothetical protein